MPIHAYACSACGEEFEELVRGDETARCPACGGVELEKKLSTFAVRSGARPAPARGPCGACGDPRGPGACGLDA